MTHAVNTQQPDDNQNAANSETQESHVEDESESQSSTSRPRGPGASS